MKLKHLIVLSFLLMTPFVMGDGIKESDKSYIYSPVGKRDPFRPITSTNAFGRDVASVNPLDQYSIEQLQLRAVLRGVDKPRAMFEDPEGKTHILTVGQTLGREHGTISKVLNTEVIVTLRTFNYKGEENLYEKVISLPQK